MDLRFAVFNLIFRDAVLRTLLVNYARTASSPDAFRESMDRSLLRRVDMDRQRRGDRCGGLSATDGTGTHVRHPAAEQVCLDAVLQRLREALPVANGPFTVRCRETTREIVDSGGDTIFKATTFEVAPHTPLHPGTELLDLPPWTERPDATAPFSLSDLVASHPGSASLN